MPSVCGWGTWNENGMRTKNKKRGGRAENTTITRQKLAIHGETITILCKLECVHSVLILDVSERHVKDAFTVSGVEGSSPHWDIG